ncbi:MAG: hypothetical protein DRJ55_01385 [Thermoprotei archaeon]|nr:hypothetical protein [Thermoproteales archaeon]RLE95684.1 MAG: hypothetical protein DRJ55_01385 [Thermoprotei archaeon]
MASYSTVKSSIEMLDSLIMRRDVPDDVRLKLVQLKKSLLDITDELVWTRSKAREMAFIVNELTRGLGVPIDKELARRSFYIEASILYESGKPKVKIEKML